MDFIKRILNTKKVKKAQEILSEKTDSLKKKIKTLAKETDDKFEVSEKFDDIKENAEDVLEKAKDKIEDIDDKFEISEKAELAAKKASELAKKAGDKIEAVLDDKISFDTFSKVEIKVGEIINAEKIEKSEKLLKLEVDFGNNDKRQIISGIAKFYSPEKIKGKKATFVTNLESRKIMGLESDGMILGVSEGDVFSILTPEDDRISAGAKAS